MKTIDQQNSKKHLHSRPLLDTPSDLELFINRADEINLALESLENNYNILVSGDIGAGKTTFMHRLFALAEGKQFLPAFCDMSTFVSDVEDFFDVLLYTVANTISKKDVSQRLKKTISELSGQLGISILGTGFSLNEKEKKIGWVEAKYKAMQELTRLVGEVNKDKSRIIFFIDNLKPVSDFYMELFGKYRDFLWQLKCNFVVTCSEYLLPTIWAPPVSSFFDIKITIKPMSKEELTKLLYLRGFKSKELIPYIHQISSGSPSIAINLARGLSVGQFNQEELKRAGLEKSSNLNHLTPSEQMVFKQIQLLGSVSASSKKLQDATGQKRARLVQILRKLREEGVLIAERQGRTMYYRIKDDFYSTGREFL